MQEAQDRIKEGNRMIADSPFVSDDINNSIEHYKDSGNEVGLEEYLNELSFQDSWNRQIPTYSKLAKAMKDLIVISPGILDDEIHDRFKRFTERYEKAIYNNDLEAGFDEIVFNLERYNEFKQKR